MKSRWKYIFETRGFFFEKDHKYIGSIDDEQFLKSCELALKTVEFQAEIKPDKDKNKNTTADQTGELYVTIPLGIEESKPIAEFLAHSIADRVSFESGQMTFPVHLVMCERVPETSEEANLLKDDKVYVEFSLVEYLGPEPFNAERLREGFSSTPDIRLLKLFNESKSSNSPIEKFLGFFKIIENFCPQKSRQPIKEAILTNRTIQEQFNCIDGVQISFGEFVEKIVKIRHESSHLKLYKNFGLTSIDKRVQSEVVPLSEILEILVYKIIKNV